jgi:hypothetical protein
MVKGLVESGKICSVEVEENSEDNSEKSCFARILRPCSRMLLKGDKQNLEGAWRYVRAGAFIRRRKYGVRSGTDCAVPATYPRKTAAACELGVDTRRRHRNDGTGTDLEPPK